MQINSYNNIVIKLLTYNKWRILRHLILFTFVLSLSLSFKCGMEERGWQPTYFEHYIYFIGFAVLFWSSSCFNIYVLTPQLLLKDRWWFYFISLVGLVLVVIICMFFIQTIGIDLYSNSPDFDNESGYLLFKIIINISSAFLSFFLLFVGTSTFVIFKNWILDMKQSEELESNTLQMELRLLENQINPHFLFNMLNNANIMVRKDPNVAVHIIGKLEEMLRYLMDESEQEMVFLKNEIVFLSDYLELEKTRRDYFTYSIRSEGEIDKLQIAPLLFITFVENAVKHNQDSRAASYVNILFTVEKEKLIFVCVNSIPQRVSNNTVGGLGLVNIKRRLNLLYKGKYTLDQSKTDTTYTVKLELKL